MKSVNICDYLTNVEQLTLKNMLFNFKYGIYS